MYLMSLYYYPATGAIASMTCSATLPNLYLHFIAVPLTGHSALLHTFIWYPD